MANYSGEEICYFTDVNRIYIDTDTLISGEVYKKLKQYHFIPVNENPYCPPFVINNDYVINSIFYLREDTISKKNYAWIDSVTSEEEQLLYDFSLNINDTLQSEFMSVDDTLVLSNIELV